MKQILVLGALLISAPLFANTTMDILKDNNCRVELETVGRTVKKIDIDFVTGERTEDARLSIYENENGSVKIVDHHGPNTSFVFKMKEQENGVIKYKIEYQSNLFLPVRGEYSGMFTKGNYYEVKLDASHSRKTGMLYCNE
jgi:hypothetical protein